MFGMARDTARRAVEVLRDEGLFKTIPQRGTYVIGARHQAVQGDMTD
jgi:DNA-binding GntR family transcriptional regulator